MFMQLRNFSLTVDIMRPHITRILINSTSDHSAPGYPTLILNSFICNVDFSNTTKSLFSTWHVEACDHHGDPFLVSPDTFSVQVIDPAGTELHTVLCTSDSGCTVTFTTECCGLHEVSGIFLGQRLINEETHIAVSSNDPALKFGGKGNGNGTFQGACGIAIDKENGPEGLHIDFNHVPDIDFNHVPDIDFNHVPDIDFNHVPDIDFNHVPDIDFNHVPDFSGFFSFFACL